MITLYPSQNSRNASIFTQYFKTRKDETSEDSIFVTPTYFLSQMIPYNFVKKQLPIWEPVSGLLNGKLPEFSSINEIPSKSRKEYLT
jgi:hypothetical protein